MAVNYGEPNVITTQDNDKILSIDFLNQFNGSIAKILEVIGAANLRPMASGSTIKIYNTTITDPTDTREEGGIIPLTKVETKLASTQEIVIQLARKATTLEEIQKVGRDRAIGETDEKLLRKEQAKIRAGLIACLGNGTATTTGANFQKALANAWGEVQAAFDDDEVEVVGFVNPKDVAEYLGDASVTIQTVFGMQYLTNFAGFKGVFVTAKVAQGTVYATAVDNLKFYYIDVNGEGGSALGYTTDESGYVGIKHYVGDERATYETGLMLGILFLAERLDGIAVATIGENSDDDSDEVTSNSDEVTP